MLCIIFLFCVCSDVERTTCTIFILNK